MNIIPSYYCNFSCPFCISHSKQRGYLLDLDWFQNELEKINCNHLNIIGGEPTMLPRQYLRDIIAICSKKLGHKPSMYTNLSNIIKEFDDVNLHVSFNPGITEHSDLIKRNLMKLTMPFEINIILSNNLAKMGTKIITRLLQFKNLTKLSLSYYTHFAGEDFTPSSEEYITFIKEILDIKDNRLHYYPLSSLKNGYTKDISPETCAEILPNNKYRISVRDFAHTKLNIFEEFDTWEEVVKQYKKACELWIPSKCSDCKFKYNCLKLYNDNTDCIVMRMIEEKINEHICKL